jgi:predicted DNA-binding transcriptional regulator
MVRDIERTKERVRAVRKAVKAVCKGMFWRRIASKGVVGLTALG